MKFLIFVKQEEQPKNQRREEIIHTRGGVVNLDTFCIKEYNQRKIKHKQNCQIKDSLSFVKISCPPKKAKNKNKGKENEDKISSDEGEEEEEKKKSLNIKKEKAKNQMMRTKKMMKSLNLKKEKAKDQMMKKKKMMKGLNIKKKKIK